MADKTISVGPLAAGVGLAEVEKEFVGAGVERMVLMEGCAYVQLASTAEVEALASRYPDCHVPGLGGAEIGFVQHGFKWPTLHATARPECLVVVRRCDRVGETSEARIRQIFKKFAIEKVARFEESGEVVLEFHSQDDLELIDLEFDNLRVPDLGPQAEIEVDNAFPIDRFLQRYLECNQQRVVEQKKKKEESPPQPTQAVTREEERVRKELVSKLKMEEMEREIIEKERLRKSELDAFERTRREKEERERGERFAREKRERDDRERREVIEQEERKKQEERRQAEERKKQQEAVRKAQQDQQLTEQVHARRETQQQQREEQQLAERIAAIKLQVEAEQGRIQDRLRESVGPCGDQSEPELQRILTQEKEQRKKEIKLPQINKFEQKQPHSESEPKQNVKPSSQERPVKQFIPKDYSQISAHFITVVVVAWIYYILVR